MRTVNHCLLCGKTTIDATTAGRFVTTSCRACRAVLMIEFDPPDQPQLRARIERLEDADDAGTALAATPDVVHVVERSFRVRSIDERPTPRTRKIVPSFDRLHAADDGLPIHEGPITGGAQQLRRGVVGRGRELRGSSDALHDTSTGSRSPHRGFSQTHAVSSLRRSLNGSGV